MIEIMYLILITELSVLKQKLKVTQKLSFTMDSKLMCLSVEVLGLVHLCIGNSLFLSLTGLSALTGNVPHGTMLMFIFVLEMFLALVRVY